MMYVYWCIEYVATFMELFLSTIFCGTFIEIATTEKTRIRTLIGSVSLSFVMLIVNHIHLFSPMTTLIAISLAILLNVIVFQKNIAKLIVLSTTILLIILTIDNVVSSIISIVVKIPVFELYQELSLYRVLAIISSKIVLLLLVVIINKIFSRKRTLQKRYLIILFSITTLMFITTVLVTFTEIKTNSVNSVISILFFAVMLILLMIIFFGTFKLAEYYENQEELKLTTLKNQMLEQSMIETEQTFSLWKKNMHDYKHNIINLKILAQNKDLEGIQKYLDEEDKLLSKKLFYYKTGNDTVDSIIYIKQNAAETKKIPFIVNIEIPEECPIASAHFASILGNLLDNAIEASEKTMQPYIEVKIKTIEDYLVIAISNRYNNQNQLLETNKLNRIFRGIGLSSVRHTVKLYKGEVSVKQKDDIFSVNIMIPLLSNPA